MRRWLALTCALILVWPALADPARAENGRLLIVGGGLTFDSEEIYRALIDHRPEGSPGIAIIAAATEDASARATTFAGELMHFGVDPEHIAIVALAVIDDPDTPDIDESDWTANAANPDEIAKISRAGAIWFTDGDPLRLTQALVRPAGFDSPMLAAIRARLAAGAIVGGEGAGAVAMSSPMIAGGDALAALFSPAADDPHGDGQDSQSLAMTGGLRLFSPFVVATDFGDRGRLGLLASAIMEQPAPARIGFGIDAATGLLVDLDTTRAEVVGAGSVTLLDGRQAMRTEDISTVDIRELRLSRLHDGDTVSLVDLDIAPNPSRLLVEDRQRGFGGIWPSVGMLSALIGWDQELQVSERMTDASARIAARVEHGKHSAIFTFSGNRNTRYWRRADDEGWAGTLTGVDVTITGTQSPTP